MNNLDRRLLPAFLLIPILALAALYLNGRTFYWIDLTYLNHPWRALPAEMLQRGVLPLWNPYVYLGMPLAAQMQTAVWHPGSLPFYFFAFTTALDLFYTLHFTLAGSFAYLWLRSLKLNSFASLGGAAVFMANGIMASHIPFLQEFSVLTLIPALLLFRKNACLLSLTLTIAFFAGYPAILIGGAAAVIAVGLVCDRKLSPAWAAAIPLSLMIGALLLFPAAQLAAHSQRGSGLDPAQVFRFQFSPDDLLQFIGPIGLRPGEFAPAANWWKTAYVGLVAAVVSFMALRRLPLKTSAPLGAILAVVCVLVLGDSISASKWLWENVPTLKFVRYPGNVAYLALPAAALLTACGLHGRKAAPLFAILIVSELAAYGFRSQPTVTSAYFSDKGPLISRLQAELDGHRYLIGPGALEATQGSGETAFGAALDWKRRLYGVTNMPFHLSAVGNFGEPLVPVESYRFMDHLYTLPPDKAVSSLPWADVKILLTKTGLTRNDRLRYEGETLWHEYEVSPRGARAVLFPNPIDESTDFATGKAVEYHRLREDRFEARGTGEGRLFLSEPKVAGWKFWLNDAPIETERAMTAFQNVKVPPGDWILRAQYLPLSWRLGRLISILAALAITAYWYNRLIQKVLIFK